VRNQSRFLCVTAFVLVSVLSGYGQEAAPAPQPPAVPASSVSELPSTFWLTSWWRPVRDFMSWLFEPLSVPADSKKPGLDQPIEASGPCSVAPLDPIEDPAAQRLEANGGADVVDTADMVPAAARALDRFQSKVESVGGTIVLKSAYRPASYQKHLQNVWYKWMDELRNNHEPGCQQLRAQVSEEFTRHRLIETQHPVTASDHTRGLAFDATVNLPANAKIGRRRITLDSLAHLAGLGRPAIAADPVHFKFFGGGGVRTLVASVRTMVGSRTSGRVRTVVASMRTTVASRSSRGVRTVAFRRRRNA